MKGAKKTRLYAHDRQWAETKEHHKGAAKVFGKTRNLSTVPLSETEKN
jgi:hypothetical protein